LINEDKLKALLKRNFLEKIHYLGMFLEKIPLIFKMIWTDEHCPRHAGLKKKEKKE